MVAIKVLLLERTDNRPNARFMNGLAGYITIHMTGNRTAGADAAAHARWHHDSAPYSWHYTVDDGEAWQQLREDEQGWHAGDGAGQGNVNSIGIEICMNEGIDQVQAYLNAAELVRSLLAKGHGARGVVQHNHWSGKDCPEVIRHEPGRWEWFLAQVAEEDDMDEERVRAIVREELAGRPDDDVDDRLREVTIQRELIRHLASNPDAAVITRAYNALKEEGLV